MLKFAINTVQHLVDFLRDKRGSLSVEAVLIFPVLWFVLLASWVFFDAYRTVNVSVKASYTISDLLSREIEVITSSYLEGLNDILAYLVSEDEGTWLRVTVLSYDADNDELTLVWSEATGTYEGYVAADITDIESQVPIMADGDTAIVVETNSSWSPMVNIGLDDRVFANLVVTSPRFAPQLCFESC